MSFFFFSAIALARTRSTTTVDDTGDYATWVIDSAGRRTEIKDPLHRLNGLEEIETVVPAAHHGAEWLLTAINHLSEPGFGG
jgi:hypothetical protein